MLQFLEFNALQITATLLSRFGTSSIDQNPPHGFGRRTEEMTRAIPFGIAAIRFIDQPTVGLVNQLRRLQCLARILRSQT